MAQQDLANFLPEFPIRPTEFTNFRQIALDSTIGTLFVVALHSDPEVLEPIRQFIEGFPELTEAGRALPQMESEDVLDLVEDVPPTLQGVLMRSAFSLVFQDDPPHVMISQETEVDNYRDNVIVDLANLVGPHTVSEMSRATVDNLLTEAYGLFHSLIDHPGLLIGRGTDEYTELNLNTDRAPDSWFDYYMITFINGLRIWSKAHEYTANFSLFSAAKSAFRRAAHIAKSVARMSYDVANSAVGANLDTIKEVVQSGIEVLDKGPNATTLANLAKSGISAFLRTRSAAVEGFDPIKIGSHLGILKGIGEGIDKERMQIGTYKGVGVPEISAEQRTSLDQLAYLMATLARLIYLSDDTTFVESTPIINQIRKFYRQFVTEEGYLAGRVNGASVTAEQVRANPTWRAPYSQYWKANQGVIIEEIDGDPHGVVAVNAHLLTPAVPSIYGVLENDGSLVQDVNRINELANEAPKTFEDLRFLRNYYTAVTGSSNISGNMYTNWRANQQTMRYQHGSWGRLDNVLDTLSRVQALGFKYDTNRDTINTMIGGLFPLEGVVGPATRFPDQGPLVCRENQLVSKVLTDVYATLSYRADPTTSTTGGRTPTTYGDTSLNFITAVGRLMEVVTREAMTRGSFETETLLVWN